MQTKTTLFSARRWWDQKLSESVHFPVGCTTGFSAALFADQITLLVASRQESALVLISAGSPFDCKATRIQVSGAMGAAYDDGALAVGTAFGVQVYRDISSREPSTAAFIPTAFHLTGPVSIHDVAWGGDERLWFLNTAFSAICTVDNRAHFEIRWQPNFLRERGPLDCCHLNGMAFGDGHLKYATALAPTGRAGEWRPLVPDSGVLISVSDGIIAAGLSLPHSPVVVRDSVWLLESGRGRLLAVSPSSGDATPVYDAPGLLRGLAVTEAHAYVGESTVRASSGHVSEILADRFPSASSCGIHAVSVASGELSGYAELPFLSEVSSVTVIPKPAAWILMPDADGGSTDFTYVARTGSGG
jgi:uncharacterized protein (TIGR03032 family)